MTEKLYLYSDCLDGEAEVIDCEPTEEGRFNVRLSTTLFHPQGGGQPADTGWIGVVRVLNVMQNEGEVVHVTEVPVTPGVHLIKIDAEKRLTNTRMHSAGHLIAVVGESLGWHAIKANHRPGEGRVVFEPSQDKHRVMDELTFSEKVNDLVKSSLPRHQFVAEGTRTVTWGELPAYACGGTHVLSTTQVGIIKILSIKLKKDFLSIGYSLM